MTYFGTNLKKIRQIKGLSQQAFAELIDLNRGVISSYEEGRAEPKIETLLRIANYFGISTDDIISKPLTVNQLANFSLIEDSMVVAPKESSDSFDEVASDGSMVKSNIQKLLALFDCVFFVDEALAKDSNYEKGTVLFLEKIKKNSKSHNNYLVENEGLITVSNSLIPNCTNFGIIGVLGNEITIDQRKILERLDLLEKQVFGK